MSHETLPISRYCPKNLGKVKQNIATKLGGLPIQPVNVQPSYYVPTPSVYGVMSQLTNVQSPYYMSTPFFNGQSRMPRMNFNGETIANFDKDDQDTAGDFKGVEVHDNEKINDDCPVCLVPLKEGGQIKGTGVCEHVFHSNCIKDALEHSHKCPVCRAVIKKKLGPCPNGYMYVQTNKFVDCPGYLGCGTIKIEYELLDGVQGPQHQNPGITYYGDYRVAYLPDNDAGKRVLELFKKAWKMKLTFTVGRSLSSGENNVITWNDIHHKTSLKKGPYGYPDATYLERVTEDLHALGVTLDE